jgi:hypothetical protein
MFQQLIDPRCLISPRALAVNEISNELEFKLMGITDLMKLLKLISSDLTFHVL